VNLVAGAGSLQVSHSTDGAGAGPRVDLVPSGAPVPAAQVELSNISVAQRLDREIDLATVLGWRINSAGQVTHAQVMWDPEAGSNYELSVILGSSNGSLLVQDPGVGTRNDIITLTPAIPAESANYANLCINKL